MKAVWKGTVIADSPTTTLVDGARYFPPQALQGAFLVASEKRTHCSWKGEAVYYHLEVDGERNPDAAWSYRDPLPAIRDISGHVAFWNGVELIE